MAKPPSPSLAVVPPPQTVFRLRITIEGVVPTVWRRLLVPGAVRLARLHRIFQAAMGWTDSHLHAFTVGDKCYGMHFDDYPEDEIDETEVTVQKAVGGHRRFSYEYDFGDSWEHSVVVEEVSRISRGLKFAVCIDGQNACPPEDCGGVHGYAELLEVLADPAHPDHDRTVQWMGGSFDATSFDLVSTNVALQQLH
jgi:hypothetical protein